MVDVFKLIILAAFQPGRAVPQTLGEPWARSAGELGVAEHLRLIDGLAVDCEARRAPYPLVVPWRARVPLVGEVEPVGAIADELAGG